LFTIGSKGDDLMFRDERPSARPVSATRRARGSSLATDLRGAKPLRDAGWLESSWDLSHGLEISDLEGELPEEFVRQQATPPG